jgi:hypothetical protein
VIQIDKQHRQLPGLAFRQANGLLQAVVDQNAVGQVGQRIVFGQMLDAGLMFLAFGNIGEEGNMVGDLPCSSVSTLIFSHSGKASPFLRRFQISPDHCPRWLRLPHALVEIGIVLAGSQHGGRLPSTSCSL